MYVYVYIYVYFDIHVQGLGLESLSAIFNELRTLKLRAFHLLLEFLNIEFFKTFENLTFQFQMFQLKNIHKWLGNLCLLSKARSMKPSDSIEPPKNFKFSSYFKASRPESQISIFKFRIVDFRQNSKKLKGFKLRSSAVK